MSSSESGTPPSTPATNAPTTSMESSKSQLASAVRPYSQSPLPACGLSALFLGSALIPATLHPPRAHIPPFLHRFGFGIVFSVAGYVLAQGDARNGSGIATAWSLTYLFLHLRRSVKAPRHPMTVVLTGGALATTALYGTEYFVLQE
ncbi:hypothetical protein GLOTRDRAFT_125188 [Gloeophyllum trabeum ATCC 11539]|uniref:Altered inheritance of mitochondria protein 19 n=1 Tax=Gloeophyllum trabeum (strain ATCC 11539 / FP-39264 / Madison 617) TaxID=670483 RepID=S7RZJ2_GLOTA|nr:uncharacterized protein GLOTRDRAFT_125188 [Gloeophyllum trabeum ATCC 11539]EPQ58869.1 hypothetical protein GLOTRDRAFT_125188 [Gloeophyllum trabeum ATCC 11539]